MTAAAAAVAAAEAAAAEAAAAEAAAAAAAATEAGVELGKASQPNVQLRVGLSIPTPDSTMKDRQLAETSGPNQSVPHSG